MSGPKNLPAGRFWHQGLIVRRIRNRRHEVVREVVLAPTRELAQQWADRATRAGFPCKVSEFESVWCYERK